VAKCLVPHFPIFFLFLLKSSFEALGGFLGLQEILVNIFMEKSFLKNFFWRIEEVVPHNTSLKTECAKV